MTPFVLPFLLIFLEGSFKCSNVIIRPTTQKKVKLGIGKKSVFVLFPEKKRKLIFFRVFFSLKITRNKKRLQESNKLHNSISVSFGARCCHLCTLYV